MTFISGELEKKTKQNKKEEEEEDKRKKKKKRLTFRRAITHFVNREY